MSALEYVERKHGKWEIMFSKDGTTLFPVELTLRCSICRQEAPFQRMSDEPTESNFCPFCGADMRR